MLLRFLCEVACQKLSRQGLVHSCSLRRGIIDGTKVYLVIIIIQESIRPITSTGDIQCQDPRFDEVPCSTITLLGEYAEYHCAVPDGLIFWFINELRLQELNNLNYTVTFCSNRTQESSTLRVLATELANNSRIECAVHDFIELVISLPALLLVQGPLSEPQNVTANIFQHEQFDVLVDVNWEAPLTENTFNVIPNEFFINCSSSCPDLHKTATMQYHEHNTISHYIIDICLDDGLKCSQANGTNSTEYRHFVDDRLICGNDTELEVAVSAVSLSGRIGKKSNSTTPNMQAAVPTCSTSTSEHELEVESLASTLTTSTTTTQLISHVQTATIPLAVSVTFIGMVLCVIIATAMIVTVKFKQRKGYSPNQEPVYSEPSHSVSAIALADPSTELNLAYKAPNLCQPIQVAEARSLSNKPNRTNTCVGMELAPRRSKSGVISMTRDFESNHLQRRDLNTDTRFDHDFGEAYTSTFHGQSKTVRDEITQSELVGFGRMKETIHPTHDQTVDSAEDNVHMEEITPHKHKERSIIVTPNKAYGSVVKQSFQERATADSELYISPVEETLPHVYEAIPL